MNDATSDYGYKLKEAEDAMYLHINDRIYIKGNIRIAQINGTAVVVEDLLFEATDISGAPSGAYLVKYILDRAVAGDTEATGIIDRLVAAYAKANAIAPE